MTRQRRQSAAAAPADSPAAVSSVRIRRHTGNLAAPVATPCPAPVLRSSNSSPRPAGALSYAAAAASCRPAVTAPSTPKPGDVARGVLPPRQEFVSALDDAASRSRFGASLSITPNLLVDAEALLIPASIMAQRTVNPIRQIVDRSTVRPNPALPTLSLALGDPTVFGNLETHPAVLEAVADQLRNPRAHGYGPSVGLELARAAVANFHNGPGISPALTSRDVVITSGCSAALDIAIAVLCDPGSSILLPRPGFALYETLATSKGVECRFYDLLPESGWQADVRQMAALIDNTTRAILINNPSNPCGSVFPRQHIRDILDVCAQHQLPLISDEIYSDIIFHPDQHPFHPAASLAPRNVPILSVGGLAKKWLVPGWRVGWILIHDAHGHPRFSHIRDGIVALTQITLGANTVIQCALPRILAETPEEFYVSTRETLRQGALACQQALAGVPGLRVIEPAGAMYLMVAIDLSRLGDIPSDVEFCEKLLEEQSVACLPGQCFRYPGYFRIVFTAPQDKLREACARIATFMLHHTK